MLTHSAPDDASAKRSKWIAEKSSNGAWKLPVKNMNAQRKAAVSLPGILGVALVAACACHGAGQPRLLRGHVPAVVSHLKLVARLPATNQLWLSIGLPLRD